MYQNPVEDTTHIANVNKPSDKVVARGNDYLGLKSIWKYYCQFVPFISKSMNHHNLDRHVFDTSFADGYSYVVDTDVTDILAYAMNMRFKISTSFNRNNKSSFISREDRLKHPSEKHKEILAKGRAERSWEARGILRLQAPARHVNINDTQEAFNFYGIIEYTSSIHISKDTNGVGDE